LAVITEDGAYYSFNVKYADEPVKLSVEMGFEMPESKNFTPVYLPELGDSSPLLVEQIMHAINRNEHREIRGINSKKFGVEFSVRGIYSHGGLIYFHTILKNESAIPLDIDYLNFKIVDRRVARRTARQEQIIKPLRALNEVTHVDGHASESTVFVLPKFTIPDNKQLVIEVAEKDGGRHQKITVNSPQLLRAKGIEKLK
jgi:conjugative transposon TraN protein